MGLVVAVVVALHMLGENVQQPDSLDNMFATTAAAGALTSAGALSPGLGQVRTPRSTSTPVRAGFKVEANSSGPKRVSFCGMNFSADFEPYTSIYSSNPINRNNLDNPYALVLTHLCLQGVKAAPAQKAVGYKGSTEAGSAPKL